MKYRRNDAKDYARAHMTGIWAASLMPFAPDLSIDEAGWRGNLRHWVDELGIAMWSHPDSGYLMSPELCARIAELPNVVAIKYSVPREMYARLTRLVGDKLLVSTASEEEWFDNIVELGWRLYLCSSPPYLFQTKVDRRMRDYTDLAFAGEVAKAKVIRDSLNPVREAFRRTRPAEKPPSHSKYWQELMGQVGGRVRPPMLELTDAEKEATRRAFETCGLKLSGAAVKPSAA